MNFFKLYIGDYQRDTGTLTLAEHGAYMLMLQHLYATEQPLPTGRDLHRLLRAESKAERDAIDRVASKFFTQQGGGMVNARALEEIRKGASQREINREIGKRGGRPRKTENKTDSVSDSVPFGEPNRNPSQTPDTRHQTKEEKQARGLCAPEGARTPAGEACLAMRQVGLASTNPGHPTLLALLDAGITVAELVYGAEEAVNRGKGFAYALKTAENRRREAATAAHGLPSQPAALQPQLLSRAAEQTQVNGEAARRILFGDSPCDSTNTTDS